MQDAETGCEFTVANDKHAVPAGATGPSTLVTKVSVKVTAPPAAAADAEEIADDARPPMDLVLVVDRSGSMQGAPMEHVKETCHMLVERGGFRPDDRMAVVAFDHEVLRAVALTSMDAAGRQRVLEAVDEIETRGTTNLSGGLVEGLEILNEAKVADQAQPASQEEAERPEAPGSARTRAVLLLTDGAANAGITNAAALADIVKGNAGGGGVSVTAFGLGEHHDEHMLEAIGKATPGGGYHFIETPDAIAEAIADTFAELTSVALQNAVLTVELSAVAPHTLDEVHSGRIVEYLTVAPAVPDGEAGASAPPPEKTVKATIRLGDLYEEDEKDVLLCWSLQPCEAVNRYTLGTATLRYLSVRTGKMETESVAMHVERPPSLSGGEVRINIDVDAQMNRVRVAAAMKEATRLADDGDLAAAREELRRAQEVLAAGVSKDHPLVVALIEQCATQRANYATKQQYCSVGRKASVAMAESHDLQRSCTLTPGIYRGAASKKAAVKRGISKAPRIRRQ